MRSEDPPPKKIAEKLRFFLREIAVGRKKIGSLTVDREKGPQKIQVRTKPNPSRKYNVTHLRSLIKKMDVKNKYIMDFKPHVVILNPF